MKKNLIWAIKLIGIIGLIWLVLFIKDIPKYRFGYFVEGPELKYEHRDADVLKLENGNVLILGKNAHSCPTQEACKDDIMPVVEVPSEIYNAKTNKIEELRLPNNIRYQAKGILLKNNRLLLTYAYDPSDNSYPKIKKVGELLKDKKPPYLYDSMAIIDLDALKVERIIKGNPSNGIDLYSFLLNDTQGNKQNISSASSTNKPEISYYKQVVFDNKVVFINDDITNKEKYSINKYTFGAKNIDHIGTIDCKPSDIKQINNQEVLIICSNFKYVRTTGNNYAPSKDYPIKTCNINTGDIKTISNMPKYRCDLSSVLINNNRYVLIAGGHNCKYPFRIYYRDSLIFDLNKNKVYNAAKLPFDAHEPIMILLNNGDVLILDNKLNAYAKKTLIFKNKQLNMADYLKFVI